MTIEAMKSLRVISQNITISNDKGKVASLDDIEGGLKEAEKYKDEDKHIKEDLKRKIVFSYLFIKQNLV